TARTSRRSRPRPWPANSWSTPAARGSPPNPPANTCGSASVDSLQTWLRWRRAGWRTRYVPPDPARHERGERAQAARDVPREVVAAVDVPDCARAVGSDRGADLVRGEHPAEHDRPVHAEPLTAQRHGRRNGGDPVEPVEDHEHPQARLDVRLQQR